MQLNWILKTFDKLTPFELYDIISLRNEVFVVEQQCIFQDADNKDQQSMHLMGRTADGKLAAYCRILPAGVAYDQVSIGRVVSSPAIRRSGAGKMLMQEAILMCEALYGKQDIKIGAQLYLLPFYTSLGFRQTSDIYLEDGIAHIEMILHP